MTGQTIDGYCHCGLHKYRPIEDVTEVMDRYGIARAVLVQHLGEYDNSYIRDIVAAAPDRFAGVMLIDPEEDTLAHWTKDKTFRGIRLLARSLQTHPHLWQRAAELHLNLVIYDEPTIAPYTDALASFAGAHPGANMIISHLGMLQRGNAPQYANHRPILDLAALPNIFVQISGMHMFADEPYTDLVTVIKRFVEAFGPDRLYYGSNFPVMQEDEKYQLELELLSTGQLGVPLEAVDKVLSATAMTLWF